MRRVVLATIVAAAAFGCSSIDNRNKADLIPPELSIRQINQMSSVSRTVSGPMPMNFQVGVANRSTETIRLERLEVQSMGAGAYTISSTTRPFKVDIAPDRIEQVEFWAPARIEDTISGANGPVTLRITAFFNTDMGQFREIYVRTVNDSIGARPGSE
jgi:hypothetical protein